MPNPIQSGVAKLAGKVGALEARAKGLKGVFTKIAEQHREALSLLARAESATDPETRRDLWASIRSALMAHERAELLELYPVLAAQEATRDISRRHAEQAEQLDVAISRIDSAQFDSDTWGHDLRRLSQLVESHAEEEETNFFPRAQNALSQVLADEVEKRFLATHRHLLQNLE